MAEPSPTLLPGTPGTSRNGDPPPDPAKTSTPPSVDLSNTSAPIVKNLTSALDDVAETMDKHGTSAWIAGVGVLLIGFVLAAKVSEWGDPLRSGEFVAILVAGFLFVIIGVAYRMVARMKAESAVRSASVRNEDRAARREEAAREHLKEVQDEQRRLLAAEYNATQAEKDAAHDQVKAANEQLTQLLSEQPKA